MASTSQPEFSWYSLPGDLLFNIAKSLDTRVDLLCFHAVCTSWRSSISPPPKTQVVKLPLPINPNDLPKPNQRGHFALTESTAYSFDPLSRLSIAPSRKDCVPQILNLLDYRVTEISKGYYLQFVVKYEGKSSPSCHNCLSMRSRFVVNQVAVSLSFDMIGDDGFVVMVLYTGGKMALWRMGDEKWTKIDDGREGSCYKCIAYHDEKFYAVDVNGLTVTVAPVSLKMMEIAPAKNYSGFGHGRKFNYLMKSFEDLFLIEKYHEYSNHGSVSDGEGDYDIRFKVYKLDEETRIWVDEVDELKDLVLFLTDNCALFILAKDFAGCKGNCIFFRDWLFSPGSEIESFYFEDGARHLSAFSECSELFWPPPTWLKKPLFFES